MREEDVAVSNGEVSLAGTLVLPDGDGPRPFVLFIGGSGPIDRDENIKGQRLDIYNTIAADLAARGVASFRYDKRGCGKSTGSFHEAGQSELLADAAACLDRFASDDRLGARFLLGHSEGTILAARLSLAQPVDGLVLLTPFIEDSETILVSQGKHYDEFVREQRGITGMIARVLARVLGSPVELQRKLIARLRTTTAPTFRFYGRRIEAKWLREFLAQDPPAIYREVTCPALLLGGGKDLQCNPADVARIAAILGGKATPVLLPNLTHILRNDPDRHTFASYGRLIKEPLEPEVVRIIGEWVAARG